MRTSLPGYYQPTKEEFAELWKNCVFAFDASVLLDLYRSTAKTRKFLLGILEKIQDRIWIPYQAAWEYQENRLEVILKERAVYSELQESLNNLANSFKQKMQNHAIESADKITGELEKATKKIEEIIGQGAKDHPDLTRSDHIRDQVTKLFDGHVGSKYDEKRLAEIYAAGAKRYEQKVPPGYEDARKGGARQYGDLVVWNELLDYAKANQCPVVFITSDSKEDWWWKQGQFTIGPRPELVHEMMTIGQQRFYMYNVERFLEQTEKNLDIKVETGEVKKAAEEFKDIQQKRETELDFLKAYNRKLLDEARALDERRESVTEPLGELALKKVQTVDSIFLKERLAKIPVEQRSTLSIWDWAKAVEAINSKPITGRGFAAIRRAIKIGNIDDFARLSKNCLEIAEKLALYVELSHRIAP